MNFGKPHVSGLLDGYNFFDTAFVEHAEHVSCEPEYDCVRGRKCSKCTNTCCLRSRSLLCVKDASVYTNRLTVRQRLHAGTHATAGFLHAALWWGWDACDSPLPTFHTGSTNDLATNSNCVYADSQRFFIFCVSSF